MLHRSVVIAVAAMSLAIGVDVAHAFAHNDAGSGTDAGNNRGQALALPHYGTFQGDLTVNDVDWYVLQDARASPVCVAASVTPDAPLTSTLRVNTGTETRTISTNATTGTTLMGIAAPSLQHTRLGFSNGPASIDHYAFGLSAATLPNASAGDAGSGIDAGAGPSTSMATTGACTGGRLTPALGMPDTDVYSVVLRAGDTIYYSIASTGANVTLTLHDAGGQVLGPVADAGEVVGVYVPEGGTYYMSASSSSAIEAPYLLGTVAGADSNPCRPYCLVLE